MPGDIFPTGHKISEANPRIWGDTWLVKLYANRSTRCPLAIPLREVQTQQFTVQKQIVRCGKPLIYFKIYLKNHHLSIALRQIIVYIKRTHNNQNKGGYKMLISTTAIQFRQMPEKWQSNNKGSGTDRYKVVFLSKRERSAVKNGEKVYFRSDCLSGGRHGTYWRYVTNCGDNFYCRVPDSEEVKFLQDFDDVCCDAGDWDAVYRNMTTTLGMTLRLDQRGIYDCESESYIHDDGIDAVAADVIGWLDCPYISSTDDFTREYASDWDMVVQLFDQWEKIKLSKETKETEQC